MMLPPNAFIRPTDFETINLFKSVAKSAPEFSPLWCYIISAYDYGIEVTLGYV